MIIEYVKDTFVITCIHIQSIYWRNFFTCERENIHFLSNWKRYPFTRSKNSPDNKFLHLHSILNACLLNLKYMYRICVWKKFQLEVPQIRLHEMFRMKYISWMFAGVWCKSRWTRILCSTRDVPSPPCSTSQHLHHGGQGTPNRNFRYL